MKSFGRLLRALLIAWVVLAPSATALADDARAAKGLIGIGGSGSNDAPSVPIPPRVLSPGAPIPVNGGVLIESGDGSEVTAVVTDPTGAIVEGTTTLLGLREAAYYAWKPVGELSLGPHWIDIRNGSGSSEDSLFLLEVVEAIDRDLPVLTASPSVAAFTTPSARACCTTSAQAELDHCALTEQQTFAQLDLGFSSTATVGALNQFVYKVRAAKGTIEPVEVAAFLPFGADAALHFESDADEYCFEVDVLDIVTMEEHRYPDLNDCVAGSSVPLGTTPVAVDNAFFADPRCLLPPVGYEEPWCEVHGDDCAISTSTDCAQFRYACEDNPTQDAAVSDPDDASTRDPDASTQGPSDGSSDEGCNVCAPGGRHTSTAFSQLALLALLASSLYRARKPSRAGPVLARR